MISMNTWESKGFTYLVGQVGPSPPGAVLALHEPGAVRGPALVVQSPSEGQGMLRRGHTTHVTSTNFVIVRALYPCLQFHSTFNAIVTYTHSPSLALVAGDGEPGAADAAGAEPQHAGVPRRHAQRGRVGLSVSWNDLQFEPATGWQVKRCQTISPVTCSSMRL